jgi:uncharacterized protein YegP (UPF0339 family)
VKAILPKLHASTASHLVATNKETIGVSQNYKSESGRNNGIDSVARNATKAEIKELAK